MKQAGKELIPELMLKKLPKKEDSSILGDIGAPPYRHASSKPPPI
jgi:hypothetical protein